MTEQCEHEIRRMSRMNFIAELCLMAQIVMSVVLAVVEGSPVWFFVVALLFLILTLVHHGNDRMERDYIMRCIRYTREG